MKVNISEGQAKILGELSAQKQEVTARLNIVLATIAAGADIEAWNGYELDLAKKVLTFVPADEPERDAA